MLPHLGIPELIIILLIIIIIFGVGKLPQIGGALGQGIREFRNATRGSAEENTTAKSSDNPEEKRS